MIPMMIPLTVWDTISTFMNQSITQKLSGFTNVAIILAATMCAFSVLKVAYDYIQGTTQTNYWQVLRPLIVLLLVCQFNSIVLRPFTGIVNVFTREVAAGAGQVDASYWKQMQQNNISMIAAGKKTINDDYDRELSELKQDKTVLGKFFYKVKVWLKKVLKHFLNCSTMTLGTVIGGILMLIAKILLFVQQMLSALYLTIMAIIGPFVFALAILPGFEGGIKSWISRYIQLALWVPVGYLIMSLNLSLGTTFASAAAASGATLAQEWLMIANEIVVIVSIAAVPKICQWFIESTGANDAHAALSQPARTASRKLFKM